MKKSMQPIHKIVHRLFVFLAVTCIQYTFAQGGDWKTSISIHGESVSCTASNGTLTPLRWTEEATAAGGGYASFNAGNGYSIIISPSVVESLPKLTALFLFFHECAHVALPMGIGLASESQEENADCYAAKKMSQAGLLTSWKSFEVATSQIKNMPASNQHLPGPLRVGKAATCAKIPIVRDDTEFCKLIDRIFTGKERSIRELNKTTIAKDFYCSSRDNEKYINCELFVSSDDAAISMAKSYIEKAKACLPMNFKFRESDALPHISGSFNEIDDDGNRTDKYVYIHGSRNPSLVLEIRP